MKLVVRKIPEPREISRGVYELPEIFPLFVVVYDEEEKEIDQKDDKDEDRV